MTLRAEVYQFRTSQRWHWCVYDTDNAGDPLANGKASMHEWATALLDAQSALQRLHLKAFQDRVDETVRKLADITDYGVPRVVVSMSPRVVVSMSPPAPPALVWEGDYA